MKTSIAFLGMVVGGGDSAVVAALGLGRDRRNEVTLSYRREKLVRIKSRNEERFGALVASGAVRPIFGSAVVEIRPGSVVLRKADLIASFKAQAGQFPGGPRALDQVIESVDLCIAERRVVQPSVAVFLEKR